MTDEATNGVRTNEKVSIILNVKISKTLLSSLRLAWCHALNTKAIATASAIAMPVLNIADIGIHQVSHASGNVKPSAIINAGVHRGIAVKITAISINNAILALRFISLVPL